MNQTSVSHGQGRSEEFATGEDKIGGLEDGRRQMLIFSYAGGDMHPCPPGYATAHGCRDMEPQKFWGHDLVRLRSCDVIGHVTAGLAMYGGSASGSVQ